MTVSKVVSREIQLYHDLVEQEAWKPKHKEAMGCLDLEELLELAIFTYRKLVATDEAWREEVLNGARPSEEETDKAIEKLFATWLKACERIKAVVTSFEDRGHLVRPAGEFRKCYAEAKWNALPAHEAFAHKRFAALRDNAIDEYRAGRTIPLEELGD